jgi:hypothetical protein
VGSRLEGLLELLPMRIFGNMFSIEGRFVEFVGIKVKTKNIKMRR